MKKLLNKKLDDTGRVGRSILSWYSEISDRSIRKKAITNYETNPLDNTKDITIKKLSVAIQDGFSWISSPEGEDFWEKVFKELRSEEDNYIKIYRHAYGVINKDITNRRIAVMDYVVQQHKITAKVLEEVCESKDEETKTQEQEQDERSRFNVEALKQK